MAEYLHGSACHYCGEILAVRISVEDVRDDEDILVDVSVEADMEPWWAHIDAHREAGDGLYRPRSPRQAIPQVATTGT